MTDEQRRVFQKTVWEFYRYNGRTGLPWRMPESSLDPYKIMVSEVMLQQTQVSRVIPKYAEFLTLFPNMQTLAAAPLASVLAVWNGLGYNRRAKFLWQAAQAIVQVHNGRVPAVPHELIELPGIGKNTAGAILAYAYNQPVTFIETNVRTVYIHHFFVDETDVSDALILELAQATLDLEHPREWYWALMDYGTHLKKTIGNMARSSKSYARQSAFEGSLRQVRGAVIRALTKQPHTQKELAAVVPDGRLAQVLQTLLQEKLIEQTGGRYHLPGTVLK